MASRIEHRAVFHQPLKNVWEAVSDEAVLQARLQELGGSNAALLEYSQTPEEVRFTFRQGIDASQLPSAVNALVKGDLIVHREQTWSAKPEEYRGVAKAAVNGIPGEILAQTKLTDEGDQVVLTTNGDVKVRIPFLGGKLEQVIAGQVGKLLQLEAEFTENWLTQNA